MAGRNGEVVRDQYAAVNARDWKRAMGHYSDDVVLVVPAGIRGGTYEGHDAVGRWFGDWFSTFDRDARFDITELDELPDGRVLVVADHHARGRASGVTIHGVVVWLYELRDGKIARVEAFDSREEALAAAGSG